jgi:aminoglycoside phosphotransferase family enzyme
MPAMAVADDAPPIAAKLDFLRGCVGTPVRTVETHMSWVVLGPERVLKLKKPVRQQFVDFTTLAGREADARAELRLNRRLAPQVYRRLLALQWDGRRFALVPESAGAAGGRTVDWLVEMQRLPDERLLDRMIADGSVQPSDVDAIADVLVPFYYAAPRATVSAPAYLAWLRDERRRDRTVLLDRRCAVPGAAAMLGRLDAALTYHAELLGARVRAGRLVEGHGDLRPEHLCLLDPPVVIDCLEFNATMRRVDPFDELCFLGLECAVAGAGWIGPRLVDRCAAGLHDRPAAALLALYTAQRASLRARLASAHLLEAAPRTPHKWLPLAQRYVEHAARALEALNAATTHGSS